MTDKHGNTGKQDQRHVTSPAADHADARGSWSGAFEAYGDIWEQVRRNPGPALVCVAVTMLVAVAKVAAPGLAVHDTIGSYGYSISYGEVVAALVFTLALPRYALALADRRHISVREFMRFEDTPYFNVLATSLLVLSILVLSTIALVIPLIWTIPWFLMATYIALDRGYGPVQALQTSQRLAARHKLELWSIIGVAILLSLAVTVAAVVIDGILPGNAQLADAAVTSLVTVLMSGVTAQFYRWRQSEPDAADDD